MKKYECVICGYIYDPAENGGVAFEEIFCTAGIAAQIYAGAAAAGAQGICF